MGKGKKDEFNIEKFMEPYAARPDIKRLVLFQKLMGKVVVIHTTYGLVHGTFITANGGFVQVNNDIDKFIHFIMIDHIQGIDIDLPAPPPPQTVDGVEPVAVETEKVESVTDGEVVEAHLA